MIPSTSSITAAPRIICPSLELRLPSSDKTLEVIPILVAVKAAPAKIAGTADMPKKVINPTVPAAKGTATPTTATTVAWIPTAINSFKFDSSPISNSKMTTPSSAKTEITSLCAAKVATASCWFKPAVAWMKFIITELEAFPPPSGNTNKSRAETPTITPPTSSPNTGGKPTRLDNSPPILLAR